MTDEGGDADHVTLKELIEHVAAQLNDARAASDQRGDPKVLKLEGCKLTLDYEVVKTAGGGIDVKVVSGKAQRDRTMSNHIEVTFTSADGGTYYLARSVEATGIPGRPVRVETD